MCLYNNQWTVRCLLPRFFFRRTRYRCQDVVINPEFVSSSSLDDNIRSFTSSLKLWKKRWQWLDDDRYDDPVPLDPLLAVLLESSQWSSDCNPWIWSWLKLSIPSGCWTTITGRCLSWWRQKGNVLIFIDNKCIRSRSYRLNFFYTEHYEIFTPINLGSLSTSTFANLCICQAMWQKYFPNCFGVWELFKAYLAPLMFTG